VIATVVICLATAPVSADDWPGPVPQNVFSDNGRHFIRIIPGTYAADPVAVTGSPNGAAARGEFYERQTNRSYRLVGDVLLQNPIGPTDALVTNAGYVVTFDNWHNFGYGMVVVIYAPGGRLIRALTVEDLYPRDRIAKIPLSVSSRWWRCAPHGYVDPEQTTIYVSEYFGGTFTFTLRDGAFAYHPGQAECRPPRGPFSASWFGR